MFEISNAALVEAQANGQIRAASTGYVELRVGVDGNGIYVDHLHDTHDMRWQPVGRHATDQLHTTAFRTTDNELQQAITRLRHVPPPGVRLPPAIVYGVPGLDLGFLDE